MNDAEIRKDLEDRVLNCAAIEDLSGLPEFKLLLEALSQMADVELHKLMEATDIEEIRKRQFIYKFLKEMFPNFLKSIKLEGRQLVARAMRDGFLGVTDAQSPVNGTHPESVEE